MIVLVNVASASIFRRLPEKNLGKAFKCLKDAKESGDWLKSVNSTVPKFALALLNYELSALVYGVCNIDKRYKALQQRGVQNVSTGAGNCRMKINRPFYRYGGQFECHCVK